MSGADPTLSGADPAGGTERPLLRIVRGDPADAELAAVVTLVAGLAAGGGAPAAPAPVSGWTARDRLVRRTLEHGAGAWRASAWPR